MVSGWNEGEVVRRGEGKGRGGNEIGVNNRAVDV